MAKFGLGNSSFKKKMASLKQEKEALAASKTAEAGDLVPDAPEVPDVEVPDVDELKDAAEDRAEEMVEEAKEAGGTAAFNMKWKLFMVGLKNKLSSCWGGAEEPKSSLI